MTEAVADAVRAAEIASDIGDVFSRNLALGWLATLLVSAGEPDRAIEVASAAIDLVADRGVGHDLVPYAWVSLARSYTALGRIDEAIDAAETALEMARRFGISIVLPPAAVAVAEALLERGGEESIARAAATIEDGMLHARRHGMQPMVIMTLSTRAAVCAAAGDEDGRQAAHAEAIAIARSIDAVGALKLLDAEPAVEP